MKLMTLNLKAVGPFTDVVLDLSGGEQGLHLIYGPNEAGKTSTLRALSHLLFGFPHLSADNFVHPNDQLRVGGSCGIGMARNLRLSAAGATGTRCAVPMIRRSLPMIAWREFLGGMNQDTFEALFGIDHERLTQAGEEIRTGQGHLGELLFAAGAGLAGLSQAQKTLQQGLDELFKPRAQNPQINKVLAEFRAAQEELKRYQLPSEEWQKHDRACTRRPPAAEQIREQIRAGPRRTSGAEADQVRDSAGGKPSPADSGARRAGDVIRLRDDFGAEFRKGQDQLLLAESTITKSRAALRRDRRAVGRSSTRPGCCSTRRTRSNRSRNGWAWWKKRAVDRVRLENFQQDCEHQARRILRELGRTIDLDEAETLRLRVDEPATIRRLGQRFAELRGQAEEARKTIARHDDQIKRQERELADLEQPRDVEPLRRAVKQARKAGDLDAGLAEARGKLARAEKKAATALAQLPGWSRSAEELERLAVPLNATLDQFESQLQETARQRQSLTERMAAEDESIRQLETRLQSLELQQDVPTEEVLLAARKRREHGWRLVKAAWLDSAPDGEAVAAFLVEFAPEGTLASAYEQSVQRGDAIADRLRREADRVAHKAESLAQLNRHRTTRAGLERRRPASRRPPGPHQPRMERAGRSAGYRGPSANAGRAPRLAPPARRGGPAPRKSGGASSKPRAAGTDLQQATRGDQPRLWTRSANRFQPRTPTWPNCWRRPRR